MKKYENKDTQGVRSSTVEVLELTDLSQLMKVLLYEANFLVRAGLPEKSNASFFLCHIFSLFFVCILLFHRHHSNPFHSSHFIHSLCQSADHPVGQSCVATVGRSFVQSMARARRFIIKQSVVVSKRASYFFLPNYIVAFK